MSTGGARRDDPPAPVSIEVSPKNVWISWLNRLLISSISRYGSKRYAGTTAICMPRRCLEERGASVMVEGFLSGAGAVGMSPGRHPDRRRVQGESVSPNRDDLLGSAIGPSTEAADNWFAPLTPISWLTSGSREMVTAPPSRTNDSGSHDLAYGSPWSWLAASGRCRRAPCWPTWPGKQDGR